MSTALLQDLHQEVRRIYIAGSELATGDFRLKRMLPQFEKLGERAPVFKRLGEMIAALIEPEEQAGAGQPGHKSSAERLQDLGSLLGSILYTQGTTAPAGDLQPIASKPVKLQTSASYRKLAAVQEALTTTGSGRYEIVMDAYEQGLFQDLRLLDLAIAGLGDPYAELAEYMEKTVLPSLGADVVSLLIERFNPAGGRLDARRLTVIAIMNRDENEELLLRAAYEGSDEVRVAAISSLHGLTQYEEQLIEWSKDKKKAVREAAFQALSTLDTDAAINRIFTGLAGKDAELAVVAAADSNSEKLMNMIIEELKGKTEELIAASEQGVEKQDKAVRQLEYLSKGLEFKQDTRLHDIYVSILQHPIFTSGTGFSVGDRAADYLAQHGSLETVDLLNELVRKDESFLGYALHGSFRLLSPAQFYERFAVNPNAKIGRSRAFTRQLLAFITEKVQASGYEYIDAPWDDRDEKQMLYFLRGLDEEQLRSRVDIRWLDFAIEHHDAELVSYLAVPGHKLAEIFLREKLANNPLRKSIVGYLLLGLKRMNAKDLPELIMTALEDKRNRNELYVIEGQVWEMMLEMPASYRERLEVVLPNLRYTARDQIEYLISTMAAEKN